MKIKKSFKYKEMLNFFKKVKRTVYKGEEIFQLVREREREREREPLKYNILLYNWSEINKLGGKKKPKLYIGTWALG
jgi:hypothetical protein